MSTTNSTTVDSTSTSSPIQSSSSPAATTSPSQSPTDTTSSLPPSSTTGSSTASSAADTSTSSQSNTSNTSASSTLSSSTTSTSSSSATSSSSSSVVVQTSSSTSVVLSTDAGGGVVTRTSVVAITSSPTRSLGPTQSSADRSVSKPFFQNKGAVAGVFTVVGVVVLALLIALITNGLRRRRARKFDREIEEAARDAAATQPPDFLDDEDDRDPYYRGGGFSDVSSHGTYAQPPMPVESYNMREMGGVGMGGMGAAAPTGGMGGGGGAAPGEIFDPSRMYADAGAAGAAGIGVARARSMGGSAGNALRDGATPYAAFAGPNPNLVPQGRAHEAYNASSPPPPMGASRDLLEAAGIVPGVGAGAALSRGPSGTLRPEQHQQGSYAAYETQGYPGLKRNKSLGSHPTSASTEYYSPQAESHQSHQQQGYQPFSGAYAPQGQGPQYQQQGHPQQQQGRDSLAYDEEDAYGGYDATPAPAPAVGGLKNPHSAAGSPPPEYRSARGAESDESDGEEEEPRRVLKVANA